jgi:hypothetical protein
VEKRGVVNADTPADGFEPGCEAASAKHAGKQCGGSCGDPPSELTAITARGPVKLELKNGVYQGTADCRPSSSTDR